MKTKNDKLYGQWIGGALIAWLCLPILVPSEFMVAAGCVLTILLAPAVTGFLVVLCIAGATMQPNHSRLLWNLSELLGHFTVCIEKVLAVIPGNPFAMGLAGHMFYLSIALASKHEFQASVEVLNEVVKIIERNEGASALALAEPFSLLCSNYRGLGNFEESSRCAERLMKIAGEHQAECATTFGATLADLCVTYAKQGRIEESLQVGEKAVRLLQQIPDSEALSGDTGIVAVALNNLGYVYSQACKYERASELYNRSLEMKLKVMPPNSPSIGASYANVACALNIKERYEEAAEYAEKAANIFEITANKQFYADAQQALGNAKRGLGKFVESEHHLQQALDIQQKHLSAGDPALADTNLDLAKLYRETHDFEKSESYLKRALQFFENSVGRNHPQVVRTLQEYVLLLRACGREEEAANTEARIQTISEEKNPHPSDKKESNSSQ